MTTPLLTPGRRRSRCAGGLFAGLALATGLTLPLTSTHTAPRASVSTQSVAAPAPVAVRAPVRRAAVRASRGGPRTAPLRYVTRTVPVGASFSGQASWYGGSFQGRRTANGEPFDTDALTAASRTLPFGTRLRVCRHRSCVVVRVNDRGPYVGHRVLDLSRAASRAIGYSGVAYVTATPIGTRRVAVRPKPVPRPRPRPVVATVVAAPTPVLLATRASITTTDHAPSLVATVGFALLSLISLLRGRRLG